jgi:hypothetical protein
VVQERVFAVVTCPTLGLPRPRPARKTWLPKASSPNGLQPRPYPPATHLLPNNECRQSAVNACKSAKAARRHAALPWSSFRRYRKPLCLAYHTRNLGKEQTQPWHRITGTTEKNTPFIQRVHLHRSPPTDSSQFPVCGMLGASGAG